MHIPAGLNAYLKTGAGAGSWARYVERVGGITYVKFTRVQLWNSTDSLGGLQIRYLNGEALVAWQRVYGAQINIDRARDAEEPVDGRLAVSVE